MKSVDVNELRVRLGRGRFRLHFARRDVDVYLVDQIVKVLLFHLTDLF